MSSETVGDGSPPVAPWVMRSCCAEGSNSPPTRLPGGGGILRVPPETRNGRAKGGYGLWQGASGAHTPQWVCKPRATSRLPSSLPPTPPEAITTVRPTGCASFSQRQRCVELAKPRLAGGGQAAAGIGQSPRLAAGKNPRQRARS